MIEEALVSKLEGDSAVAALVQQRIYANELPQSCTYPAILFKRISGARVQSFGGSSGLAHPVFQVDAIATTYAGAKVLAEAIRGALWGFRGVVAGVNINGILMVGDLDLFEEDAELHRVSTDFEVWHNE